MATFTYGSLTLDDDDMPMVGRKVVPRRLGDPKDGPMVMHEVITVRGTMVGDDYHANQTTVAAMHTELIKDRQALYWHDGTSAVLDIASGTILVEDGADFPAEWGQYEQSYTFSFRRPIDATHNVSTTCTYGGYTFDPCPAIGTQEEPIRGGTHAAQKGRRVTLSISGEIQEGSLSANLTELTAMTTALQTDSAQFVFGSINETVIVKSVNTPTVYPSVAIPYAVVFEYTEGDVSDGVIRMKRQRTVSGAGNRHPKHMSPYVDGSSYQDLGEVDQTIRIRVLVEADTIGQARTAAAAAVLALKEEAPSGGEVYESPVRNVAEGIDDNTITVTATFCYTRIALQGGVYGDVS